MIADLMQIVADSSTACRAVHSKSFDASRGSFFDVESPHRLHRQRARELESLMASCKAPEVVCSRCRRHEGELRLLANLGQLLARCSVDCDITHFQLDRELAALR